jgi:hypothetical protein
MDNTRISVLKKTCISLLHCIEWQRYEKATGKNFDVVDRRN